jgi:hypothetical protein
VCASNSGSGMGRSSGSRLRPRGLSVEKRAQVRADRAAMVAIYRRRVTERKCLTRYQQLSMWSIEAFPDGEKHGDRRNRSSGRDR